MTGKFDEDRLSTDDRISLAEIDAEYFSQSVRERIDFAVQAKAKRQLPSRYFYEVIEEAVEDFLEEERCGHKSQEGSNEIRAAYNELMPAFRALKEYAKDDRALDGAIRDVMWNSFLIGLACDVEKSSTDEMTKKYLSFAASKAREAKKEKNDRWKEAVYLAVCSAVPHLMFNGVHMENATKTYGYAKGLEENVKQELIKMKLDEDLRRRKLTVYAIKIAVCRYLDDKRNARRIHKRVRNPGSGLITAGR